VLWQGLSRRPVKCYLQVQMSPHHQHHGSTISFSESASQHVPEDVFLELTKFLEILPGVECNDENLTALFQSFTCVTVHEGEVTFVLSKADSVLVLHIFTPDKEDKQRICTVTNELFDGDGKGLLEALLTIKRLRKSYKDSGFCGDCLLRTPPKKSFKLGRFPACADCCAARVVYISG